MGIIILRKRYEFSKYLSVFMISVGIVLCTIISGSNVKSTQVNVDADEQDSVTVLFWWGVGITLLTVALFISARMGIYQEVLYKRYGKYPDEALFYTHLLPLPFFFLLYQNIYDHTVIATSTPVFTLPLIEFDLPIQWIYLIANVLTQYLCISSVYVLTTECSSLTVTLIVTLRKFVSLLFSIVYFRNPFTIYHWIGTILVFLGTIIFTEVVPRICNSMKSAPEAVDNKKAKKSN